jgi:hypothetical protein
MTPAAWIMLAATWSVIAFFTGRFFLAILRTPVKKSSGRDVEGRSPGRGRDQSSGQNETGSL